MNTTTSAYRFTRHADEYAVTRPMEHLTAHLGSVRRAGKTWTARPASVEQGAHLYVTEHWTRANAAAALDAAHLAALAEEHGDDVTAEAAPAAAELAPGMYRVRVTVTNRDGVHTATEDMNPAAIELARSRPGWSVEILGESRVTIAADEEDTAEEQAPAGRVRLIGIGNVPAVPLSDVRPGDRIAWNYGQTYTVVRNTQVAANTYELVERGEDGREWTRRKRGTKLVARRPALTPPPTATATSYATHCTSCDCTYAAVTSTDGPAIGYEYQPDGFTVSTIRHICWPRDERTGRLVAARRAAAGDHRVRVIRPAHTIEQGARIVLDDDTVTVLDVDRDDTARTVTLVTSYGAPRTVTRDAAVPVVSGEEDAAPQADEPRTVSGAVIRPIPVEMQRQLTGERQQVDRGTCGTCKTGCGHRSDEAPGCAHYGCLAADGATADTCPAAQAAITGARVGSDPRTVTGTPENVDARASARARGERAAQLGLTFDESDRQAMTVAQLRAPAGDALALF